MQYGGGHHRSEEQSAWKTKPVGNDRDDARDCDQDCEFVEDCNAQRCGSSWRSMANQTKDRQSGWQSDGDDYDANALHNCDCTQIAAEFGSQREHL